MTSLISENSEEQPVFDLYFACNKPEIMKALDPFLTRDTAGIVADYVLSKESPFGIADWKKYGVDASDAPKLEGFYTWWFGPDPIEPAKQCCETHSRPVLRPADWSIKKLHEWGVKFPRPNTISSYDGLNRAEIEKRLNGLDDTSAGPALWIVSRPISYDIWDPRRNKQHEEREQEKQFIKALNKKAGSNVYVEEPLALELDTIGEALSYI